MRRDALVEEGFEFRQPLTRNREARGLRMAAAIDQQSGLPRGDDGGTEIEPVGRAPRSFADVAVEGDDAGRPLIVLAQPARDDADHAGMPALARNQYHGASRLRRDMRVRRLQHRRLDRLALAVETVEVDGNGARLVRIVGRQQARAEIGGTDAAARVDPRPEYEAEMISTAALLQLRDVGERDEPGLAPLRHDLEPLRHQRAVEPRQRYHVADRAERHQIERLEQVGFRTL